MESVTLIHDSVSSENLHGNFESQSRQGTHYKTINNQHHAMENSHMPQVPSALNSMLKITTETGDIGQFSITSSHYPGSVSRTSSFRPKANTGWEKQSQGHQTHSNHAFTDDRKGLPSYTGEPFDGARRHYPSQGQHAFEPSGYRSYSMTQASQSSIALTNNRSCTSLRSQPDSCSLQRPRSPFAYPTRLRRPGCRPSSPALTDEGHIDYSRRAEIERIRHDPNIHNPLPSAQYRRRRGPTLTPRYENHRINALSHAASHSQFFHNVSVRAEGFGAAREWNYDQTSTSSKESPARSTTSLPQDSTYHRSMPASRAITPGNTYPPPSPRYYDYTEEFECDTAQPWLENLVETCPPPPFSLSTTISEDRVLSSEGSGLGEYPQSSVIADNLQPSPDLSWFGSTTREPSESFSDAKEDQVVVNPKVRDGVSEHSLSSLMTSSGDSDKIVVATTHEAAYGSVIHQRAGAWSGDNYEAFELNNEPHAVDLTRTSSDAEGVHSQSSEDDTADTVSAPNRSSWFTLTTHLKTFPTPPNHSTSSLQGKPGTFIRCGQVGDPEPGSSGSATHEPDILVRNVEKELANGPNSIFIPDGASNEGEVRTAAELQTEQITDVSPGSSDNNQSKGNEVDTLRSVELTKYEDKQMVLEDQTSKNGPNSSLRRIPRDSLNLQTEPVQRLSPTLPTMEHTAPNKHLHLNGTKPLCRNDDSRCGEPEGRHGHRNPLAEDTVTLANPGQRIPQKSTSHSEALVLAPKPISLARERSLKNSIPQLMKALPPLPNGVSENQSMVGSLKLQSHASKSLFDTFLPESTCPLEAKSSRNISTSELRTAAELDAKPISFENEHRELLSDGISQSSSRVQRLKLKPRSTITLRTLSPETPRPWNSEESYPWDDDKPNVRLCSIVSNQGTNRQVTPTFNLRVTRASITREGSGSGGTIKVNKRGDSSRIVDELDLKHPKDLFTPPAIGGMFRYVSRHFGSQKLSETGEQPGPEALSTMRTDNLRASSLDTGTYQVFSASPIPNSPVRSFFSDDSSQSDAQNGLRKTISHLRARLPVPYTARCPATQSHDDVAFRAHIRNATPANCTSRLGIPAPPNGYSNPTSKGVRRQKLKKKMSEWFKEARGVITGYVKRKRDSDRIPLHPSA